MATIVTHLIVTRIAATLFGGSLPEDSTRHVTVPIPAFTADLTGYKELVVAAADEAFDFSNNPSRPEWAKLRVRSLSVGDVVQVYFADGRCYVAFCQSCGWKVLILNGPETEVERAEAAQAIVTLDTLLRDKDFCHRGFIANNL
jgi:hypothetical protein